MDEHSDQEKGSYAREVWALKKELLKVLAGHPTPVQEVALADAIALMIANKQPKPPFLLSREDIRRAAVEHHIESVLRMIPVNEEILRNAKEKSKLKVN